jgi:hypothetical protein
MSLGSSKTDEIGFAKNRSGKPVKHVIFWFLSDLSIQFKSFSDLNFIPIFNWFSVPCRYLNPWLMVLGAQMHPG